MNFNNLNQLYRSVIMDHYKTPRNKGVIDGDAIRLTLDVQDEIVQDAKFDGEGCSISLASASMMTEAIKGKSIQHALEMSEEFSKMMLGEDYDISEEDGDIEALSGVSQFPARIKCATLTWKALEKGVKETGQ